MNQTQTHRVRTEYDRLAESYDQRWSHYVEATLRATLEGLDLDGNEYVLDVPVGTGELVGKLLQKWPQLRIAGADLSPGMLEQAAVKHQPQASGPSRLSLHEACVTSLPFGDEEFDCVFCVNSFHYFPDAHASLSELQRVMRDGGRLILVDWCDDFWICKLCSWWLRLVDRAFHRMYSQRDCENLLRTAGFRIKSSRRFRVGRVWGLMRIEAIRESP